MLETDFEALSPWGYKRVEFEVAERADFFGESWSAAKFLALPLHLGEERRVCTPHSNPGTGHRKVDGVPWRYILDSRLRKANSERSSLGKRHGHPSSQLRLAQVEAFSYDLGSFFFFKAPYPRGLPARAGQPQHRTWEQRGQWRDASQLIESRGGERWAL